MASPVPKHPSQRRNRSKPRGGEWKPSPSAGWQHGRKPAPPRGLSEETRSAWATWFAAWFAAHWTPSDLPGLRTVARLYDDVEGGDFTRATELRLWSDNYGITPKGQQARRWLPPTEDDAPAARTSSTLSRPRILATLPNLRAGSEE